MTMPRTSALPFSIKTLASALPAAAALCLSVSVASGRQAAPPAPPASTAPTAPATPPAAQPPSATPPATGKPVTATPGLPPTGAGETGPMPTIAVVGPQTQQIGRKSPLELISGTFRLRNTGDKALTVTKIEAGCRCTNGVVSNPVIAPGGETQLNYELDLRGTLGPLRKPIRVRFAGFDRSLEVVVQGELHYDIRAEPPTLKAGPNGESQFTLTSLDGKPFRVLSVQGESPTVVSKVPSDGEAAVSWTLVTNVNRTMPYAVVVETDHPTAPVIDLRVMGGVTAQRETPYFKNINDISIGRHLVNLGVVKPGGSTEFDFYITRIKDFGKPVTLATDGGDVKLELVELGAWRRPDDNHVKVKATFREGVKGVQLFPVYVTSEGKTNRTWACAVVK
ncbi:MAG: DUF1573 domain-containing protein [Phycisphaerales bacterium]